MRQPKQDSQIVDSRRHGRRRALGRLTLAMVTTLGVLCAGVSTASANNALVLDGATDGTGDYVLVPDSPVIDLNTFTLEAWVNWGGVNAGATVISRPRTDVPSAAGTGYALRISSGFPRFGLIGSANVGISDTVPATPGVWTHIAGTFDGQVLNLYVNG